MAEFADICKVFLDAVLDGSATFDDFEQWLGRRPWAEELLELESLAWAVGLRPGFSNGQPGNSDQCVICGEVEYHIGYAACGDCGRRWCCGDCLTWNDEADHLLCPLCLADREVALRNAKAPPLRNTALADALAKM